MEDAVQAGRGRHLDGDAAAVGVGAPLFGVGAAAGGQGLHVAAGVGGGPEVDGLVEVVDDVDGGAGAAGATAGGGAGGSDCGSTRGSGRDWNEGGSGRGCRPSVLGQSSGQRGDKCEESEVLEECHDDDNGGIFGDLCRGLLQAGVVLIGFLLATKRQKKDGIDRS